MNSDSPKTPREEMEAWLTSLLLGELSEGESAAVRELMKHDPELAKLHDRLQQSISLVRETVPQMEAPLAPVEPLKLSEERRQRLLTRFKIPPLKIEDRKPKPRFQFRLIEALVVLTAVAVLAAMLLPALSRSKSRAFRTAITSAPGASQVDVLDSGRTATELLRTDAQVVSGGGGSTNVNSLNVVGYVERVLPPQSTRGDSTLSINALVPAAQPPVAATPASEPARQKQVIILPSVADAETTGPARAAQIAAGQDSTWGNRSGNTAAEDKKPNGVPGYSVSDPEWAGILERPQIPHSTSNRFITRYAYSAPPPVAEGAEQFRYYLDLNRDGFYSTNGSPVATPEAAQSQKGGDQGIRQSYVAGRSISPTTGLPMDNLLAAGATVAQTTPATTEELAFRKRYGLSAANSAGGGGTYFGGAAIAPQPNAGQQTAGGFLAGFASTPAPAASPALQPPAPPSASAAAPVDALAEKAVVLGDLPTLGRSFRSESRATERAGRGFHLLGPTPQPDQLGLGGTLETGVAASPQGKPGGDATHTFGVNADADGLARSDSPQQQKQGNVRLADGSVRGLSRSKLQEGLQNSVGSLPDGGRVAAEPPVLAFDVQDFAKMPATPEGRVAATDENGARQQRGSSIVLPQVEQEIARVPAYDAGRAETLTRGRAVPARSVRASESEIAGKPASTVAPAQAGEQLLTEARPISVSPMPSDAARQRVAADKKEKADVMAQVTDGRVLLEAGKLAEAEAKLTEAIKSDPENRAAAYYLALAKEPRAATAERGLEQDSKKGIAEDELLPPGFVNFSAIDVKQALSIYGELSGKKVLQSTNLPEAPIALKQERAITKQEAIRMLDAVLASNGIEMVKIGTKFVKAIPLAQANSAGAPLMPSDLPIRKPSTNAPIPQPEIQTSENAFSTFSLNVSDVSFKFAAASLEKGQTPDPASVRSEEFINAFDYRDPEPPPGAPIAFAWERARYPFAHNRDLLRFSLKTAAAGRQAGRPLNIVLLLDNSGSMERADRVRIIREALRMLAGQLQPQDKLSVITFARTPRLVADGISGDKAGEVTEQVGGLTPQGGTNLEEAMNLAYQTALRHYLAGGINRVVLLTDGAANLGNVEPESLKQKVEAHRKQGVALDCFGIGWEGFNDDLLEVLSRNGDGRYGFINSPEEAASEFAGQLAGALKVAASDVKVQVEFNPRRVTSYRQIGYAKHQLTKEQFRDNTVDAAEIAAQEAGNALYTAEVNPAGEGPLCTVRVRFRFAGTWEYREQAWDVPYAGNAVSLEQSSPAMRLAASASAFAEWLVASPFAAEVTPDRVLGVLGGVPEVYGADARPKKLEWMLRQAKSAAGSGGSPSRGVSDKVERPQFP